jgi:hypothetical protein
MSAQTTTLPLANNDNTSYLIDKSSSIQRVHGAVIINYWSMVTLRCCVCDQQTALALSDPSEYSKIIVDDDTMRFTTDVVIEKSKLKCATCTAYRKKCDNEVAKHANDLINSV